MNKSGKAYEQKCFYFAPLRLPPLAVSLAHRYTSYVIYLMLIFVHDLAEEDFFRKQLEVNVQVTQKTGKMQSSLVLCVGCRANGPLINYKLKNYFSY